MLSPDMALLINLVLECPERLKEKVKFSELLKLFVRFLRFL